MNDYIITSLTPNVVYVRLETSPSVTACQRFLKEVIQLLDEAPEPLYFLMDFRRGYFTDAGTLMKLAVLTQHPRLGITIGFGRDELKDRFAALFASFAHQPEVPDEIQETAGDAIALLEKIRPGLLDGINWEDIIV